MRLAKSVFGVLAVAAMLTGSAFAEQIGVVDMAIITQKYSKSAEIASQDRTRQEALAKLNDELTKQMKAGEKLSPVEKKSLEEKLRGQMEAKLKEYRDWATAQESSIRSAFDVAVKQVSASQKLDVVLPKQAVLVGGKDVTNDVVTVMNNK